MFKLILLVLDCNNSWVYLCGDQGRAIFRLAGPACSLFARPHLPPDSYLPALLPSHTRAAEGTSLPVTLKKGLRSLPLASASRRGRGHHVDSSWAVYLCTLSAGRRFACLLVALLLPALFNTVRLYRFILVASALQRTPELQRGLVLLLC